jgi:hypothetical protein
VISSVLLTNALPNSFEASSMKELYRFCRLALSSANRVIRACDVCESQEAARDVTPPMAEPASAASAEMYATSILLSLKERQRICR